MSKHKTENIFGIHSVESVLRNNPEQVLQLWVQAGRKDKRIQTILGLATSKGISVETCSRDVLQRKSGDHKHQGVVARVRPGSQPTTSLDDVLSKEEVFLLLLDDVQDPHNLGACLRSADAAGVDAVIVSKNRTPGLTAVVRNVASGAAETTPFIQVSNLAQAIRKLKDNNIWVVGADGDADTSVFDSTSSKRLAIVMGSEGRGMRKLTRDSCDELVTIPMSGKVESLNVSVATGICLFEYRRKQMTE